MRKIKYELTASGIKKLLKTDLNVTIILFFQCITMFFLLSLVFSNMNHTVKTNDKFQEFIGEKVYYTLQDSADEDGSFDMYMNEDGEYEKLKRFVDEINSNENITLISTILQPISVIDANFPEKFVYGYESGTSNLPIKREDGKVLTFTKSMQISENVFSEFGISVESGRNFSGDDYTYDSRKILPAIMGSEYKEYLKIGDRFQANDTRTDLIFEVVGFFAENTYIPVKGELVYTDRYIVIPYFCSYNLQTNMQTAKFSLLNRANGEIVTLDKSLDVQKLVDLISEKNGTIKFKVNAVNADDIVQVSRMSAELTARIVALAVLLAVFSVLGLSVTVVGRIRRYNYEFGVHMLSGASVNDIVYQVAGTVLYIVFVSFVVSQLFALIFVGSFGTYMLSVLLVALTVAGISLIAPIVTVKRMNVSDLIRRKE